MNGLQVARWSLLISESSGCFDRYKFDYSGGESIEHVPAASVIALRTVLPRIVHARLLELIHGRFTENPVRLGFPVSSFSS